MDEHSTTWSGSELLGVEVLRACRRVNPEDLPSASAVLGRVELVPLTRPLLADAAVLEPPLLRSLDAVHLASALSIREAVSAFVVYDQRLAEAATAVGLPVVAPGS